MEGTGTPIIQLTDRDETILSPDMPIIEKIGTMARLCYRTEPKEGEDVNAVNERIIRHCIKSGHESVLEHGAISVYIAGPESLDAQNNKTNFFTVFHSVETEAYRKYIEIFMDPSIYGKTHEVKLEDDQKVMRVLLGDVRAWRQVVREKILFGIKLDNKMIFLIAVKVLNELAKAFPILFEDIVKQYNDDFNNKELMNQISEMKLYKEVISQVENPTISLISSHFFKDPDTVLVAEADNGASVSLIYTTDRVFTHQHVRHRKNVAYSQESQRYVNYDKKGLRVIPLTMEPSKFLDWCEKHDKKIEDIFENYDTGKVRSDSLGGYYFVHWYDGAVHAAMTYTKLLNLKKHWGDTETGKLDLPDMPVETARDKLENDTATRLGVTWLRPSSFINFVYWRLDQHAQYSIRSTLARVLVKMFEMRHPFLESIPFQLHMRWLNQIKEQKLFKDNARIDRIIAFRQEFEERLREVSEMIQKKKESSAPGVSFS